MGYEVFAKKSTQQLTRHIQEVAKDTSRVVITRHAGARMRLRRISTSQVYQCLQKGAIRMQPEPNAAKGSLECRMERYVAGCECQVVVALCDEEPGLLVVTVMK